MSRKKVPITIYARRDQCRALADASLRLGVPQAAIVREGVDMALRLYEGRDMLEPDEALRVGEGLGRGA